MKNRKKICFVVSTIYSAEAFLMNHIKALKEYYDVYIVANLENSHDFKILNSLDVTGYENVKIVRRIDILKDINAVISLSSYFRKMKFDSIHSITPKAGLICQLAGWMAGIKIRIHIFTGQVWCNMRGTKRQLLLTIDKVIARLATNILVDGKSQKEFLVAHKVVGSGKAIVLGEGSIAGVDLDLFIPSQQVRRNERKKLNIPSNLIVYSFLGRLNRDKGVPELLKAFSLLCNKRDDVFLILFGKDEESIESTFSDYESLVEGRNFLYAGFAQSSMAAIMVSDVFCLPSHREGFGMSVIEAEALSIPVICSDAYGLRDTIINGVTGLRHSVADVDSLYDAMLYMAENPDKREAMGKAAREYVETNFSSREITRLWVDYYKKLLN